MTDRGAELVVLFGNELTEVPPWRVGIDVGGAKVHPQRLVVALLAMAVVDLVRRGAGTLDVEDRQGLQLRRRLVITSTNDAPGFTGLVARSARRQEVRQIARHVLGTPTGQPAGKLLDLARQPFLDEGVLVRREPTGLKRLVAGAAWEFDGFRREALRPAWNEVRGAWENWKRAHPDLVGPLLDETHRALHIATPADKTIIT